MAQEDLPFSASDIRRSAARRPLAPAGGRAPVVPEPERANAGGTADSGAHAPLEAAPAPDAAAAPAWTVTELTRAIAGSLVGLGRVRVEGEISALKRTSSGHVYFDLKDAGALVSCVVWKSQAERALRAKPADGMQVLVHGALDVYGPHGRYKLAVDRIEPLGLGALLVRLEELKAELSAKGWFGRARPLPTLPRVIGIVTSRDGAALSDFLRTRSQRWPLYPLRLCHAAVQGADCARDVARAIRRLDASGVDVIVVMRGGGSLEDLWGFNEREVAEAIFAAGVPVISAVGHEKDTSLSDFVADHRAHTPTDAAQTIVPDRRALLLRIERAGNRLVEAADQALCARVERLGRLARARVLRDPTAIAAHRLHALAQTRARLTLASNRILERARARAAAARLALERHAPARRLAAARARLALVGGRLVARGADVLAARERRLALGARSLEATSPLAVLSRGYSITTREGGGALLDASRVSAGERLETRLAQGSVVSRVESVRPGAEEP